MGGHEDFRELSNKSGDIVGSGLSDTRLDLGFAHEQKVDGGCDRVTSLRFRLQKPNYPAKKFTR